MNSSSAPGVSALSRARRWAWTLILAADVGIVLYGVMAVAMPQALTAGYESYTGSTWANLDTGAAADASYVLLLYRLVGGLNIGLGLVLIAVVVGAYRRGERWAWFTILAGNAVGFGAPMAYDQVTGAIGTFEVLEFVAVAAVLVALVLFPGRLADRPPASAGPERRIDPGPRPAASR